MADLTVEGIHPALFTISGKFNLYEGTSPIPPFTNPNPVNAVQDSQFWGITCEFKQVGWLVPLIDPNSTWRGRLMLDRQDGGVFAGFPPGVGAFNINFVPTIGHAYTAKIDCSPGDIGLGIYEVSLLMQLYNAAGKPAPLVGQGEIEKNLVIYET